MKQFRKVIFWCHLSAGVIAGIIVLIMSVTGVLLTYEKQLTAWADERNYRVAAPESGATHLPIETLLAKVRESQPGIAPVNITLKSEPTSPAALVVSGNRTIFVNPYTGQVLGDAPQGLRNFFHVVTDWHRWLGTQGAGRATARAITGACNLAFLFIVVSGFYLWFPRTLTWLQFKNILWFRRGLRAKARDFNWHNVIGFWSLIPLFIIVLSGVVISYPWASNLVYRAVGENPPAPPLRQGPPPGASAQGQRTESPAVSTDNLNVAWTRAEQHSPGWKSLSLRLPNNAAAPLAFTIDHGSGGQPQKRATLTLNRQTGDVMKWETFASNTTGRQLRTLLRFAHTGEVGGIIGQTIAGIVSLGAVFLVWTGLALSLRRFKAWRGRRRSHEFVPASEQSGNVIG